MIRYCNRTSTNVPVNSKTAHTPFPGQSPGIWLALSSVQWGIWPKMRPAQWGIWLSYQNVCQRSEAKGFRNSIWFSRWAAFTGHGSFPFHVGFSVVVVLYSSIVEYAFVLSVERRQAEQEIRNGWKFCGTCFHSLLHMPQWRVGDLTLFEALTGGAFDRLNWQHSGEFDQNFSKKVLELTGTLLLVLDCKTVVFFVNASDGPYSNERSGASVKTARENGERR